MVEVLQAATRVLAGVALRSLDALDGAVSLPQFRVLAVLADLGCSRSAQVADALGLDASTASPGSPTGWSAPGMSCGAAIRATGPWSRSSSLAPGATW